LGFPKLRKNERTGADLYVCAAPVRSVWPWKVAVLSAEDGRRFVDEQLRNRAKFVKVYTFLSRDAFFAIADGARLRKIPVVGHVPMAVAATEALNAEMKSMEHLHGVLYDASSKSVDLNRRSAADATHFTSERSRSSS
jgi:hypothetical protein